MKLKTKFTIDTHKGYLTGAEVLAMFRAMVENDELMEALDGQYGSGFAVQNMFDDWSRNIPSFCKFEYKDGPSYEDKVEAEIRDEDLEKYRNGFGEY